MSRPAAPIRWRGASFGAASRRSPQQGVTVVVTTHFMEEAEYCDRVAIMDAGRVLAQGTPAEIRDRARSDQRREPNMEDAFIAVVEAARAEEALRRAASRGVA